MSDQTSRDPLHGVTLEKIVRALVETYGWAELAQHVPVRCFLFDPSVSSSLTFLRRTPWARAKVEQLYVRSLRAPADDADDATEAREPHEPEPRG